uniref:AsmA-like C-terminal region n=1 Tax=Candidatus Kentrum eta TaxID=2126337 RepID=A0A450UNU3_9GAMM|nr:MAG: AsmA-like C-terminal region [Candidatus Kentron sp. H]VFJ94888.1 MAG: AsmA-like C-terminal region [Candidatus Kentron sp. H]VFK01391.1 MAG: AsmA-like C-terminal region [Candidatus Kentron sp. H]
MRKTILPGKSIRSLFLSVIWALILLVTLSLVALRLSLPRVDGFLPDVEHWLQTTVGQAVSIGALRASWRGWTPELVVEDIRFPDSTEEAPSIRSLRTGLGIDLSWLWGNKTFRGQTPWEIGAVRTKRLSLSGVSGTVIRDSDGTLRLAGVGQRATGFLSWLLRQPHIDIQSADIHWRDEGNEALSFSLRNLRLSIRETDSGHRILATVFPDDYSPEKARRPDAAMDGRGPLSGIADMTLDPATFHWSGTLFLRAKDLDLYRFPLLQSALPPLMTLRTANFGLWTSWDEGRLQYGEGNFTLGHSVLTSADSTNTEDPADPSEKPRCLPSQAPSCIALERDKTVARKITGRLALGRVDTDNWRLRLDRLVLTTPQGQWPPTCVRLQAASSRNQHGWRLRIRNAELTNRDLTLRLSGTGQWFDDHASPDFGLVVAIDDGKLDRLTQYLPTTLMKGALVSWLRRTFPQGRLARGQILFHGRPADFPFDNGEGVFEARLRTSPDTTLRYARAWAPLKALAAHIVFDNRRLRVSADSGSVYGASIRKVTAEIPDIMATPPVLTVHGHTVGPLDEGLAFLRTGPLSDRYAHRVTGIQGTGEYRLDLQVQLPLPVSHTRIGVKGKVALIDNTIGIHMSRIAAGAAGIDTCKNKAPDLSLDRVRGALAFSKHGIAGQAITARYLGQPVTLAIAKTPSEATQGATDREVATRFTIEGLTTDALFAYPLLKSALQKIPPSVASSLAPLIADSTDKATWRVTLDLPNTWGRKDNRKPARLRMTSALEADLPPPLARPFQAEVLLSKGESAWPITIRFGSGPTGPQLTGILAPDEPIEGKHEEEGTKGWRMALRLGAGPISLPARAGIRVHGHTQRLSLDQWLPLLRTGLTEGQGSSETSALSTAPGDTFSIKIPSDPPKTDAKAAKTTSKPKRTRPKTRRVARHFDIRVGEFTAFARTFRNVRLRAGPADDGRWYIRIQGDGADGYVRLPRPNTNEAIVADFAHLQLPPANDKGQGNDADPRNIPSLRFTCGKLTYQTRPFGKTRLELAPIITQGTSQGVRFKTIDIESKNLRVQGHGTWRHLTQPDQSSSRLEIDIRARDLGKLLTSFGYEGNVAKEGKTRLRLNATWPGSPAQFELARISGVLHLKAEDGRLLAIDPGTPGRVFGLLSVTQLPRRLSLDFRELHKKGFVYDRMVGKFKIVQGKAETTDFFVDGATLRIGITGSTGLVDKSYDQVATIIPKVTAASIALPTVGIPLAAIGIAQHLLDEPFFDKVFAYQYTIKGAWDDPQIELVQSDWEDEDTDNNQQNQEK